ncbi:hypothetical protein CISG_03609 [Coccidioides immitis RMSCC 3703]|uniref:Retroviral polymerase SH3-like domain-containing protein n=2 Tax=Coccidioides immitis TaxID=5501 RepID=A0A0J8QM44_COCIT|nr:hypothetical protein CIRG_04032 [Coccidioides immitis RMSCC 2394]KMU73474.1 hypothetical protein CISG_03609 [Coccidioides immitis RMSCC 3703]
MPVLDDKPCLDPAPYADEDQPSDSIPEESRLGIKVRLEKGFLVGYGSIYIYCIWNPSKDEILHVQDVRFDETRRYDPEEVFLQRECREAFFKLFLPRRCNTNEPIPLILIRLVIFAGYSAQFFPVSILLALGIHDIVLSSSSLIRSSRFSTQRIV